MAIEFTDEPGNCPEPSSTPDPYMGGFCASNFTFGPAVDKFCWDRQPDYSAFRESSFGHGILEVLLHSCLTLFTTLSFYVHLQHKLARTSFRFNTLEFISHLSYTVLNGSLTLKVVVYPVSF